MKLINWNISIKLTNSGAVGSYLLEQDADIITLQEVVTAKDASVQDAFKSKEHLDALFSESHPYSFFGPLWSSYAQPKRDFGGLVEQGNYTLSKYPIIEARNEFFHRDFEHIEDWSTFKTQDHPRAVEVVEIDTGTKRIQLLNIHGIWTEDKQGDERTERECAFLVEVAGRKSLETIIIGDFNLVPESPSIKILEKAFRNLNTEFHITSTRPAFDDGLDKGDMMVDYAFVNESVVVEQFTTLPTTISDHLPLVLEFS